MAPKSWDNPRCSHFSYNKGEIQKKGCRDKIRKWLFGKVLLNLQYFLICSNSQFYKINEQRSTSSPALWGGFWQQQQVFTLREDEGEAAVPARTSRQFGQVQDLLARHDCLAAALQQNNLVGRRERIVAHEEAAFSGQTQKPFLPLLEQKSTWTGGCGGDIDIRRGPSDHGSGVRNVHVD